MHAHKPNNLLSTAEMKLLNKAFNLIQSRFLNGEGYTEPSMVKEFVQDMYRQCSKEVAGLLLLDSQHRLIDNVEFEEGEELAASMVYREVLKVNAAAVIVSYFSPSKELSHSEKEHELSALKSALNLIDVSLLDCMLVTDEVVSLAERGLL
ncbi:MULTISPECIES: JAB domain-containing protein [Idiomarina]|jgi:DNA repair protein RadC|uniref:JAB domain-containing protein n=1 Tax=Idiomarina TaxID=135575 RepID=UPI000C4487BA|nr:MULTISPECIES: JAB domain-containing protein [Idiomarina]MAO68411.1 DNA repair protein RadC [Idiomarina sp.]MBF80745.1 DNA repair protein RadC [Idiomarina sp.]|tara:strand:- start:6564 stop:7016 length:453 start_codon:yes stop_codon:yes gene_type:complete